MSDTFTFERTFLRYREFKVTNLIIGGFLAGPPPVPSDSVSFVLQEIA